MTGLKFGVSPRAFAIITYPTATPFLVHWSCLGRWSLEVSVRKCYIYRTWSPDATLLRNLWVLAMHEENEVSKPYEPIAIRIQTVE
mmetsp:Transcript_10671/g.21284  ORF Transcript_10671/g.21284 Transcript_10671/m.21284 type:complete len:86 (-) Transcript_10671:311-568(-)